MQKGARYLGGVLKNRFPDLPIPLMRMRSIELGNTSINLRMAMIWGAKSLEVYRAGEQNPPQLQLRERARRILFPDVDPGSIQIADGYIDWQWSHGIDDCVAEVPLVVQGKEQVGLLALTDLQRIDNDTPNLIARVSGIEKNDWDVDSDYLEARNELGLYFTDQDGVRVTLRFDNMAEIEKLVLTVAGRPSYALANTELQELSQRLNNVLSSGL